METTSTTTKTRRFAVVDVTTMIETVGGKSYIKAGSKYELGRDRYHAMLSATGTGNLVIGMEWIVLVGNFHIEEHETTTVTTRSTKITRV